MKVAVRYGDTATVAAREGRGRPCRIRGAAQGAGDGPGRVAGPRYIKVVEDVRSELVIPLLSRTAASACSISRARSSTPSPRTTSIS